jgi:hypothetical protein
MWSESCFISPIPSDSTVPIDVERNRQNHLSHQGVADLRKSIECMGHIKTLHDADQYTKEKIDEDKKNIVREVEVIVERKVYLEIPKEVIRKVEVIKEVVVDGALAVSDPAECREEFSTTLIRPVDQHRDIVNATRHTYLSKWNTQVWTRCSWPLSCKISTNRPRHGGKL